MSKEEFDTWLAMICSGNHDNFHLALYLLLNHTKYTAITCLQIATNHALGHEDVPYPVWNQLSRITSRMQRITEHNAWKTIIENYDTTGVRWP